MTEPAPQIERHQAPAVLAPRRAWAWLAGMAIFTAVLFAALMSVGCSATLTPTQRLSLAENAFNTAQESATALHAAGVIPPQDDAAIVSADHAARAALNAASTHLSDTTFNTAASSAEAAIASFAASVAQAKASSPPKPVTQPAK